MFRLPPFRQGTGERRLSSRISPIHKKAFVGALLKPALKWVGRAFVGAGDNVLRATSKWWDDGAKAVAKEVSEGGATSIARETGESVGKKSIDDLSELAMGKQFAGDFAAEADQAVGALKSHLSGAKAQAMAAIKSGDQLTRLQNTLNNPKEFTKIMAARKFENVSIPQDMLEAGPEAVKNWLIQTLKGSVGNIEQAKAQLYFVDRAVRVLREPNGVLKLQKLLDMDPKMQQGFFGSGLEQKLGSGFRNFMIKVKSIDMLGASKLGDTKFIQRALQLKSNNPKTFSLFMAHPQNAARFEKMQLNPGYIGELIEKGSPRIPLRRKLIGVTPAETAKRLGLGAATLTGGYGAIKLYNWFGNNDPQRVAAVSKGAVDDGFQSSGAGARVLVSIKQSLKKIEDASNNVNSALASDNAESGAQQYIKTIVVEKENLKKQLEQWDAVIEGTPSDQQDAAYKMGSQIQAFVNELEKMMGEFTSTSGVGAATRAPGRSAPSAQPDRNIVQVQGLLKNLDPSIQATGQLDDQTTKTLTRIEARFNQISDSNQWTGALVDPASNYVISSSNLKEAFKRIRKYK